MSTPTVDTFVAKCGCRFGADNECEAVRAMEAQAAELKAVRPQTNASVLAAAMADSEVAAHRGQFMDEADDAGVDW